MVAHWGLPKKGPRMNTPLITRRLLATLALGSAAVLSAPVWAADPAPAATPGTAQSQAAPKQGPMAHMGERMKTHQHARMAERHQRRLDALKAELKLEAGQEAAWNQFAAAMQPPKQAPAHLDRASMAKLSTPERLDHMQQMHKVRDARMSERLEATRKFYAALKPEQQKVFDQQTARAMAGERHGHGGHGSHGGQHGHGPMH